MKQTMILNTIGMKFANPYRLRYTPPLFSKWKQKHTIIMPISYCWDKTDISFFFMIVLRDDAKSVAMFLLLLSNHVLKTTHTQTLWFFPILCCWFDWNQSNQFRTTQTNDPVYFFFCSTLFFHFQFPWVMSR